MVVREVGILAGSGITLVRKKFHLSGSKDVNKDLRNNLITALLNFAEYAFSSDDVEYFEATNYLVAFSKDKIFNRSTQGQEFLFSYAIIDKEKRTDKLIHREIKPLLDRLVKTFINKYNGEPLSLLNLFYEFKDVITRIFKTRSITVDQRLEKLLKE